VIKELHDLPEGVEGFSVSGKIHADEYEAVVLPAVTRAAEQGEVRFLIEIPDFDGMTSGALKDDLTLGIKNFNSFKRVAVVSDIDWIHHLTALFGWMTPGEVKVFGNDDREAAVLWVTQ